MPKLAGPYRKARGQIIRLARANERGGELRRQHRHPQHFNRECCPHSLCDPDHCCFSQNESSPCDAEPPITQGMPTATWPSAAAETQPSATAPTPTCPQKSRLRLESEPLALSSSTAASASLRT